ncbi:MAG: right-handed parallel beta-helix repeat-containing protein [Planctomycetota bacterium]|nr:right-handed parallel beta-helix repeat-containing protein [Planctomycetota bacterium]
MLSRVLLALALSAPSLAQTTWYVDVNSPNDPGTGTAADPYRYIQYAIDQAATIDSDRLLLAPGQYAEDLSITKKRLYIVGDAANPPALIGAYTTTAILTASQAAWPWLDNIILDGSGGQRCIECTKSNLTVQNSTFLGANDFGGDGGQVEVANSTVRLENCQFKTCAWDSTGGVLYGRSSTIKVDSCSFTGGCALAGDGGGIFATDCILTVKMSSFYKLGTDDGEGGAMALHDSQAQIEDCLIQNCGGLQNGAGGIYLFGSGSTAIMRTQIKNCSSEQFPAGALWLEEGYLHASSCEFDSNSARYGDGGAVYVGLFGYGWNKPANNASADFEDCTFTNNQTHGDLAWGMGIGGAVLGDDDVNFKRCTFTGNRARGVYVNSSGDDPGMGGAVTEGGLFEDCLFVDNRAYGWNPNDGPGQGGAIGHAKLVRGCTFFRNVADPAGPGGTLGLGGAVYSGTLEDSIVWNCGPVPLAPGMTVNFSNVEGGWTGAGTNNVNGDPRFASPATGNFTLTGGSASIDVANPSSAIDPDGTPADQGMAPYTYGSIGTVYCTSNPNSTGAIATMNVRGETLLAFDTLRLESDNLPVGQFGFYLASPQQGFVPNLGGGQGNLCLGAPIVRLVGAPAGGVLNSGIGGQFRMRAHMLALPSVDRPSPGETWHFQAWFRDGSSSNTSNAVRFMFM